MDKLKEKHDMKPQVTDIAMYQAIFDSSLAGLFVVDAKGCILKANPRSESIFGYEKGAMIDQKINIIFPKRYHTEFECFMKRTTPEPVQLIGLHRDGMEFAMDIRMVKTVMEGQTIATVYCKPANSGVFESDRKLRTLIGNIPGIAYRCKVDPLWTMEFISTTCQAITGYAPGQFYDNGNLNWCSLIHPQDSDRVTAEIKKAISKKKSYQFSYRILTVANKIKWINEKGACIEDHTGNVYRLEGFMQDITERKKAEIALFKEKERLVEYLDTAASIFLVINTDHSIELVNRKGCEVLGYSRQEIVGKNWFHRYIPKKEQNELAQFFDDIIEGTIEPPDVYENWVVTKGNKRKLVRWRNALMTDENGKVTGLISSGVDITEEEIALQELRKIEKKNRAILEALPDIMTVHDEKGSMVEIHVPNQSYLNAPKETLEGKNVNDLLPEEVAKKLKRSLSKVLRTQKMETIEINAPVSNESVDYECRLVPLAGDGVLTIARDITLQHSLQRLLSLKDQALEAAGNGIIIADAQNSRLPITYCNRAFSKLTGYRRSEVIGKNCRFLQNDDRDQDAITTMAKAIQKGEACRVLLRNYRKDGSLFWNELSITPLYDEEEHLTHFIGVQNDVTEIQLTKSLLEGYVNKLEIKVAERTKEIEATVQKLVESNLSLEDQILETKLAESNAKRSQSQFAAIAQNFPKGLIAVFNTDFELVYVEGEELKRVNLDKADFEGKRIDDVPIFSTKQIENIKADIRRTIKGKSLSFELEFQDNFYTVNSTPLHSDDGAIVWVLLVYHNVTEQKMVQEELAKALKVEQELNELKSRFISMASHEFRTPLSAILSSAILIGKQNGPGKEKRRMKHVSRIRNNVKNLVVILNDFLSLSKLEEGKVKIDPKHFELVKFSKLLVEEMESSRKDGQIITVNIEEEAIAVYLDPKLLRHILVNLLSNACKYSDEGKRIGMTLHQQGKEVVFTIKDEGIGIPKKEYKNLFERFFRAENVANIQGTGLGLHIVKQYVELMEGSVEFTSELGKGSTFTVQLPRNL